MLIVGSEFEGISPLVLKASTDRVRIQIATSVDSLNAAVAASICLHRLAAKPI
jgi:tRNA G18 (ribose-2'-O)-methylase SpoU